MLQQLVIGYLGTLKEIHTLSTGSINKIISVDQKGFHVETETSRAKFKKGEKKYPFDLIPQSYLLEVWNLLKEMRTIHAGDLNTSKGRSSFLLALFSNLPFVEETQKAGRSAIGLKEYFVNELPESNIPYVLEFLEEVVEGKYHPQLLYKQIEDKNAQRLKSSYRQGLRLLGFIDENFIPYRSLIDQYLQSKVKKTMLKEQMMKIPYLFMVQTLISAPFTMSIADKTKAIKELGMLVERNPNGGNLMKESVGDKLSRNTLAWLDYVYTTENESVKEPILLDKGVMEMKMLNKDRPGICYSNISLIKKALLQNSDNILPYPEILLYLKKNWTNLNSTTDDIKQIVDLALNAPKSYFCEVEDGLWGIKDKTDARLNHIYFYMDPRKIPLKISDMKYRLKVYESDDILKQMLLSDIRFSQIENTPYWILSEWVIINNLVYDYIFNSELLAIDKDKVIEKVVQNHKLDKEKAIFLPQFDDRFSVFGNRVEIKRTMVMNPSQNEKEEIEIPVEIREEVGRLSYKVINFIKENSTEVTTNQIVNHLFQITQNEPSFSIYREAIKALLEVVPEVEEVEEHKWSYLEEKANLELENDESVYYAVKNSVPTIENVEELLKYNDSATNYNNNPADNRSRKEINNTEEKYAYHTISYYDRVKGYFLVPTALIEKSVIFRQNNAGKIMIQHDEYRYEWNWEKKDSMYYFFGDGVMDFFADYLIEPGHKLSFEIDKQIIFLIRVHKVGFDERYASEQQRYLDIGRLVEESKSVKKSIFSLMCEILAIHPSGLHWSVLQDKITEKRTTTKNTITNLLSRNECFEQVEGKKGYWKLNISKLSRYYINEDNQDMVEPVESVIDSSGEQADEPDSLKIEPREETSVPFDNNEKDIEIASVEKEVLQHLSAAELIQKIDDTFKEIIHEEQKFKEAISERVKENFMKGNISVIEGLYHSVSSNLRFFERVRSLVTEREGENQE